MENEPSREQIEYYANSGGIVPDGFYGSKAKLFRRALCNMALSYLDAKADAGRYRFIRYHSPSWFTACWAAPNFPSDAQIDTAIDAAMKGASNG